MGKQSPKSVQTTEANEEGPASLHTYSGLQLLAEGRPAGRPSKPTAGPWDTRGVTTDARDLPPVRPHRRERCVLCQEGWLEGFIENVRELRSVLKDESKFAGWPGGCLP